MNATSSNSTRNFSRLCIKTNRKCAFGMLCRTRRSVNGRSFDGKAVQDFVCNLGKWNYDLIFFANRVSDAGGQCRCRTQNAHTHTHTLSGHFPLAFCLLHLIRIKSIHQNHRSSPSIIQFEFDYSKINRQNKHKDDKLRTAFLAFISIIYITFLVTCYFTSLLSSFLFLFVPFPFFPAFLSLVISDQHTICHFVFWVLINSPNVHFFFCFHIERRQIQSICRLSILNRLTCHQI